MKKFVALSALLVGLPMAANAGFYVGAGIGNATGEILSSLDDNDLSFNVNAGYDLTEHLAIDLGYQDWGKLSDSVAGNEFKAEIDMITVSTVAKLPLGESFDLFGRLGVAFTNTEITDASSGGGSEDFDGEDFMYGFGADWNIGNNFSLRAELDWVEIQGFNKARNLSLSALYNFDI